MMSRFAGAILDVDGVILASPHEQAWREALDGLADPAAFMPELYRSRVAGKSRRDGALAALVSLGVHDAEAHAEAYAVRKQARLEALIADGKVRAFPDALNFLLALKREGVRTVAASSSKNATAMMRAIRLDTGGSLLDALDADVSGRAGARGKPAPDLFLAAASALGAEPGDCLVVEDASAGVRAAKAGGMRALGVARSGEVLALEAAGADAVVSTLDDVDLEALGEGRLERRGS